MQKVIRLYYSLILSATILFGCNEPAAVKTTEVKRDRFSYSYPANWTIDKKDEDYDPDALFSLDHTDESSTLMYIIFDDSIDTKDMLINQEEAMKEKLIKKPESVSKFSNWGNFTGDGIEIKGKALGVLKYNVRIFVWSDSTKAFLVLETTEQKNKEKREKDFEVMRSSFKWNE